MECPAWLLVARLVCACWFCSSSSHISWRAEREKELMSLESAMLSRICWIPVSSLRRLSCGELREASCALALVSIADCAVIVVVAVVVAGAVDIGVCGCC